MANERRSGFGFFDRVILFTAWVVTCGLVYLLGFYVGKGTQVEHMGLEERVVRLPVTSSPPREGQRPKTDGDLTFYDKLVTRQSGERPPAEPAAPKAPATGAPAAAAAPAATASAKESKPAPPKPAAVGSQGHAAPAPAVAALPRPVPVKSAPPAIHPAPAKPAADAVPPPAVAPPPTEARATPPTPIEPTAGAGWTVLANPTRSREDAEALERQLRGRGYDVAVVRVLRDGDTWYRLRVGRYASADQAAAAMHKLREHEGVEHAFVASE